MVWFFNSWSNLQEQTKHVKKWKFHGIPRFSVEKETLYDISLKPGNFAIFRGKWQILRFHKYRDNCLSFSLFIGDVDMVLIHMRLLPTDMALVEDYMELHWIGTTTRRPVFNCSCPRIQYKATTAGLPRNSNNSEGWHNWFRSLLNCSNCNIWKIGKLSCHKNMLSLNSAAT